MSTRWRSFGLPEAALLAFVVLAWVLIAHQGMRNHVLQPDEALPVLGSRYLGEDFPGALFSLNTSGRGLERALAITFAFVQWLVSSTPAVFKGMHILAAGSYAAVALVMRAWARELGLGRWAAAGTGACALALPWAVFGITFLNAAPAQTMTPLALYACWRAIVRPSPGRDGVALLALLALGLVRVGNLPVALAVPVAVVVHALHDRAPGVPLRAAVTGLPARVWREHPVWVLTVAAGAIVLAVGGIHRVVGHYPVRAPVAGGFRAELRIGLGQIAAGVALVPAIVGGGWAARSLVASRTRGAPALAALLLGGFAALCYAAATQGPEERYVSGMAPVLVLAFAVALGRREAGLLSTALAAVVVGREVVFHAFPLVGLPFGALGSPGTTFFQRVAVGKASLWLPVGEGDPARTLAVVAGIAGIALVLLARRRTALAVAAGLAVAAAYGGAAGLYSAHKFTTGAAYPGLSFATQAWVDGKVGSDADVAIMADPDVDGSSAAIFREVQLFNRSLGLRPQLDLARVADSSTGTVRGPVADYLVSVPRTRPLGLVARQVASATYLPQPLSLDEVARPARLAWAQQPSPAGGPIVVRFFRAPPGRCAALGFQAPPGSSGVSRYRIVAGANRMRGALRGVTPVFAKVALSTATPVDVRLRITHGGGQLIQLGVTPC